MPVPTWVAQVNKRVFNPMEIRRGKRPVLVNVGRKTGQAYVTPLDAHPIEGGYIFIVMYGASNSDWVKNVLAAGSAHLHVDGREVELTAPRLIGKDAAGELLPPTTTPPPDFLKVTEYLRMDVAAV